MVRLSWLKNLRHLIGPKNRQSKSRRRLSVSQSQRVAAEFEILEARALLSGTPVVQEIPTPVPHPAHVPTGATPAVINQPGVGTWRQVTTSDPNGGSGTMTLLSNGTILVEGGGVTNQFEILTPDAQGNYFDGTWTAAASMGTPRLYTGEQLLPNGQVFIAGGEYNIPGLGPTEGNTAEIYDPVANKWTPIAPFPEPSFGDGITTLLPNGEILSGYIDGPQTFLFNPTTGTWTQTGSKLRGDLSSEESWVLLPDGSVLSYDIWASPTAGPGSAQRYIPSTGTWVDAGIVPVPLTNDSSLGFELGPATLLPDGRVFFVGANGSTVFYTPSTNRWTVGPSLPIGMGSDDAPGTELPNGHFLFAADTPLFNAPTQFFELDPTSNTLTNVTPGGILGLDLSQNPSYVGRFLNLPNGDVMFNDGDGTLWDLTPSGVAQQSWRPAITNITANAAGGFTLTGTQLTGISAGSSYGDDAQMATNYPIVAVTDSKGNVTYATTTGWTPGVSTGNTLETVNFTLPKGFATGAYTVSVSANGISSGGQLLVTMGTNNDNLVLQESPTNSTVVQLLSAGAVIGSFNRSTFSSIVVVGDANTDTLTVNLDNGDFMSTTTVNYIAGTGAGNGLAVEGLATDTGSYVAADVVLATNQGIIYADGSPITFSSVPNLDATGFGNFSVNPAGSSEVLHLQNGTNQSAGIAKAGTIPTIDVSGSVVDPTTGFLVIDATIAVWSIGTLSVNTGTTQTGNFPNWLVVDSANGTKATGANVTNLDLVSGGTLKNDLLWPGNVSLDGNLVGDTSGAINTFTGPIVTGGSVTLRAQEDLTVTSATTTAITAGGTVYLAADTTPANTGDDGKGALWIAAKVTSAANSSSAISLIGATYVGFANTPITTTASAGGIVVHPSFPATPMNVGGTFDTLTGLNLSDSDLTDFLPAATGSVTYGGSNQTGNIIVNTGMTVATPGASTFIVQSSTGVGSITINDGPDSVATGTGLDGNGGLVTLKPGLGNIAVTVNNTVITTALPMATNGFNGTGLIANLAFQFAPVIGTAYTIISNTSSLPFAGNFDNLVDGGVYTTTYLGKIYSFNVSYKGGDGNDLVLTAIIPGSAVLSNIETSTLQYIERATAIVSTAIMVSPVGADSIDGATVQITGNYDAAVDNLLFTNTSKISGSWDALSGTLTLSGKDTTEDYQAALRSVAYYNSSQDPLNNGGLTRTITFATPNGANESTVSRAVQITPVNNPPVIILDPGIVTIPQKVAVAVSPGLLVSDPDNTNLYQAQIRITTNYNSATDTLVFTNTATIKGTWDKNLGMLKLVGNDTVANYQTALRSIKFLTTSQTQIASTRVVTFAAADPLAYGIPVGRTIEVQPVHIPPVLSGIETSLLPYVQNTAAVSVTSFLSVSDFDSTTISSATIQITGNYFFGEDLLSFQNTAKIIGNWNPQTATLTLSGTDTLANYQSALRSVKFFSSSGFPLSGTRTVSFQVNDGANANNLSNIVTRTIALQATPLLTGIESTPVSYSSQGVSSVPVTSSLQIDEFDPNAVITKAVVKITNVQLGDLLSNGTLPTGVTASWSAVTGTLTFTGTSSVFNYTNLLQSVEYGNFATTNPSQLTRDIQFQVFNGSLASNIVDRSVVYSVTLSNIESSTLSVKANGAHVTVSNSLAALDSNSATTITGAVVWVSMGFDPNRDWLEVTAKNSNILWSYNYATGRLIFSGTGTLSDYQTLLESIKYYYKGPQLKAPISKAVSFQVSDSSTVNVYTSNVVTRNIVVS